MKTFTKNMLAVLGIMSLWGCQKQEEVSSVSPGLMNEGNYYELFEEGLNAVFNDTYQSTTISSSFDDIAYQFEKRSKDFFASKGMVVTNVDIAQTRGVYTSPFSSADNLSANQKRIVDEVLSILQLSDYKEVKFQISQLQKRVLISPQKVDISLQRYIDFILNVLNFLEKESGRMSVLNVIVKYNDFHEIELLNTLDSVSGINTREPISVNLSDGLYPHPLDRNKFIMVVSGRIYEMKCADGLAFCDNAKSCGWIDQCSSGSSNGWWERWGRCAAAILGGAGTGGLAGGGVGSSLPGLGTVAGAIVGAISGAFSGAAAGC